VLAVAGVLPIVSGRVLIGDVDLRGRRPDQVRAAGLAVVPEGRHLLPTLTVAENLDVATFSQRRGEARTRVREVLELFPELTALLDRPARLLSGGQQQMVVLAQALACRPQALVIDELSLGLAPVVVRRLVPVLEHVAARGVAVLLIEQFAHIALELARGVYIVERGRVIYQGTAAQLRDQPELMSAAYLLRDEDDRDVERLATGPDDGGVEP
jgi:branched-chain amino acid transport system ATP-binding protein